MQIKNYSVSILVKVFLLLGTNNKEKISTECWYSEIAYYKSE